MLFRSGPRPGPLDDVEVRLHLRDPLKLNLLIAEDGIQDLAALVQEIDDLVEFVAADIRPASLRYPSDLRRAAGWLRACARGAGSWWQQSGV